MPVTLEAFGPLLYPLLGCSLIALVLILERLIYFITWKLGGNAQQVMPQVRAMIQTGHQIDEVDKLCRLQRGTWLLLSHAHTSRELREEMVNHWLAKEQNQLFKHFGWLTLLAVISPMLGLLGTVLGIIQVFTKIAAHTGPVFPALLADGLGQAMLTTAAGLSIAVPVLIALHGYRIWGNSRLTCLAEILNEINLAIDGVDLRETGFDLSSVPIPNVPPGYSPKNPHSAKALEARAT